MSIPRLAIILPCFNEETSLDGSWVRIAPFFQGLITAGIIHDSSRVCFVDDGSQDLTWSRIEGMCRNDVHVIGVKLSRNFGHQGALLGGLTSLQGSFDCYITIDVDLQDDLNAIREMVDAYCKGAHIVYGVREDRSEDSFFKRFTAEAFYRIMTGLGVKTIFNHADFRLISEHVLLEFMKFPERNLFLRGMFPLVGFPSSVVYYKHFKRESGDTKYPLSKMLTFAWNGITAFSTTPIRAVLMAGIITLCIACAFVAYSFYSYFKGQVVPGWTSTLLTIAFFSALQMISLGVIGEYIGKIYIEVKRRPLFIVEKKLGK